MNELKKYSPAYQVDKIRAALLLVHGEHDRRVPIEHYASLTKSLDKINYPYEAIIKKEVHGFYNNKNKREKRKEKNRSIYRSLQVNGIRL